MLNNLLRKLLMLDTEKRLLVFANSDICDEVGLRNLLLDEGFLIYEYTNVEIFRVLYEENIKLGTEKVAVIVLSEIYVPYDVRKALLEINLSAATLFPNLNSDIVMKYLHDWDIISYAVTHNYSDHSQAKQTEWYITETVFSIEIISSYCQKAMEKLQYACNSAITYQEWIRIAKCKATIEYYAAMKGIKIDLSFADEAFKGFIANGYGRLSSEVSKTPSIVTKTLSAIMADKNEKSALIVMDGMSLFDFKAISRHFNEIEYDYSASYALIPTMTPISRQSLLSGKYPRELSKPFSLENEEKGFLLKAASFGLLPSQVEYLRGYDNEIHLQSKLVTIIINDVDDIAHGQHQGRTGMYNDMDLLGKSGKIQLLIHNLTKLGFTVYITADHGNTLCTGVGSFRGGVEIESRSMRMAVLKDFAEANTLLTENTTEYQGYYLNKDFRYFVCKNGVSFDNKGEIVMTHGGMSLDEVIVPFIKVRGTK